MKHTSKQQPKAAETMTQGEEAVQNEATIPGGRSSGSGFSTDTQSVKQVKAVRTLLQNHTTSLPLPMVARSMTRAIYKHYASRTIQG